MTRHYILRLLNQGRNIFALAGQSLEKAAKDHENDLLFRLESLAPSELAAVDIIVRLHRSLSNEGKEEPHQQVQLKSLEEKLWRILGMDFPSESPQDVPRAQVIPVKEQPSLTVAQALDHLNRVSELAQKYLGKVIVANYWRATRPSSSWLADFVVTDNGYITYHGSLVPRQVVVTANQQQQLETWLVSFVDQCRRILPLFRHDLQKAQLSGSSLGPESGITAVADKH
ncbi:hypothetical protein NBE99_09960 [Thermosynechococcus sp. HN-54]|uniref:hypothetical protein n=1 Tax=Thermosynechococcus sp. HN-54 TaxID=2933959 RepID=UPI00202CFCF9|nr:hypothetical protein [Thermosynechococcus sp. HN-54]URR34960.1 hypothetical protein NBE99_09960 [Thermosynechococcus sp. HN-54]